MNLIALALAAETYFQQQPIIEQTTARCVRTKNVHATCDQCAALCPTGAIRLESGLPELTPERCIKCGVCLHTCPLGVFQRPDGFQRLLANTQRLREHQVVDVACVLHPTAQTTAPSVAGVVQTKNCLAELGVSAWVGLLAVGVEQVRVRLDACAECPLRVLYPSIEQGIAATRQLLAELDRADAVVPVYAAEADWVERPLHHNTPAQLSRRNLFASLVNPETAAQQQMVNLIDEGDSADLLPRERRRLLKVLRLLTEQLPDLSEAARLDGAGFAQLVVSDTCTACGLCERVCPTKALQVSKTDDEFMVIFEPHLCLDCHLCIDYCEPQALEHYGAPALRHVLDEERLLLHSGPMQQCTRCKAQFVGSPDEALCPTCRFRREHPGGVGLPEAVLAQLPAATRERVLAANANRLTGSSA